MTFNRNVVKIVDTLLWTMLWLTVSAIIVGTLFGIYDVMFGALV